MKQIPREDRVMLSQTDLENENKSKKVKIALTLVKEIWYNIGKGKEMRIIPTIATNLHLDIQKKVQNSTQKEIIKKEYQKNREEFLKRVYQTLRKNFVKSENSLDNGQGNMV